jgi:hypothetical protein
MQEKPPWYLPQDYQHLPERQQNGGTSLRPISQRGRVEKLRDHCGVMILPER